MRNKKTTEINHYTCLFCGKTFTAEEVLFADEITTAKDTAPDNQLRSFFDQFISAPSEVPTQLLHSWTKLPPEACQFSDGEDIPSKIHVRSRDGILPKSTGSQFQENAGQAISILNSLSNRAQEQRGNEKGPKPENEKLLEFIYRAIPETLERDLYKRICPHCHCTVPAGIGTTPVYRIAMLGGTSAGKTTYMLLATSQMTSIVPMGNTLNTSLNLADGKLIGESEAYFTKMFSLYLENRLEGTPTSEYVVKTVFPLVLRLKPNNGKPPFFLIFQDFPGEGMVNNAFMINYPSLLLADGAVLLVDPNQLMPLNDKIPDGDSQHNSHCQDTLEKTCRYLSENIQFFKKMQKIVVTLNKLDCLYKVVPPYDPVIQRGRYPLLDNGNLRNDHQTAINISVLDNIHRIVNEIFAGLPRGCGNTDRDYQSFLTMLGCAEPGKPIITFKAISSYSWNEATESFVPFIGNKAGLGHRLLEPVLELLGDKQYLPTTDGENSESRTRSGRDSIRNPKKFRLFS